MQICRKRGKNECRANTQDTAWLQQPESSLVIVWNESKCCLQCHYVKNNIHKSQNYSKPTLYALDVSYPSVIRVQPEWNDGSYLHPSRYPGERIHPLPPRGPAGWHQSELRSIQNQSPGERSRSVTTSQSRFAIHQCVRRSSSLSSETHTPYLIQGFSAPASAEVIFKLNAPRKGTGVQIKFSGSQRFWRPRQHKDSGAAETQSLALA